MKRNLDSYGDLFRKAKELHEKGMKPSEIAKSLGLPAQTVMNWLKRGRRKSQAERFVEFLREKGPMPIREVAKEFPKHSDIYLKAVARGYDIRKFDSGLKGDLRYWYYLPDQEGKMKEIIEGLKKAISEAKERLKEML